MVSHLKGAASLVAFVLFAVSASAQLSASQGQMDARFHDFTKRSLNLEGEWRFTPTLIDEMQARAIGTHAIFTEPWKQSKGSATYQLTVLVDGAVDEFALDIPQLYSAYTVWVNGREIARNGQVGATRQTTLPQWMPQVVTFRSASDTLLVTVQIANFHHAIGGARNPIILGLPDKQVPLQSLSYTLNTVLLITLTVIGLVFVLVYAIFKREKSVLFFALLCLTWALRSIFSEQYLAIYWVPTFDWGLALKIEYITLYMTVVWAMLFVSHLYPLDTNKWIKAVLLYPNFVFVFLTMATPAQVYTELLGVYLFLQGALLIYILVVVLRATVYERYGAWFSTAGIVSLVAAFGYNYLSYQGLLQFNPLTFYACYLIFFILMAVALGYQLSPKAQTRNFSESLSFDDVVTRK